jgi:serine protease
VNHRNSVLSLAVVATLSCAALPAFAGEFRAVKNPVQGQYIVVLKDNAASLANERSSLSRVSVVARDVATKNRAKLVRSYNNVLRGFVARADDKALARLLADPRVAYVEEDGIVSINATQSPATWGLDRIDQRNLPLNNSYTYDTTAPGVHAYIIDTGVLLNHVEFSGRMGNGYDAVTSGGNANDCNGHGTHVAGTVGGTTYGVAKGVTIHPVRVLGCTGSGTNAGVIAGMDWVANNHVKPAVANMSLGGGASQATDDAVQRMTNAGVTVVVAAGNSNDNACNYSPARAPSAITTGSTTNTDARSSFSSFGSCLDIYAPGSNITSAWYTNSTATNTISGTSMASPHVAGVAALYLATNPSATPAQVTTAIVNNATPNVVTSPGSGSPNRLLYSLFGPPVSTYSVSGTIATSAGTGIAGVTVSTGGATATTNSSGAYTLSGLSNGTYTLTPSLSGYTFSPASRSVTVNSANVTGQDFTGTGTGGGNTLTKGVPVTGLGASTGNSLNYTMVVPSGATNLTFTLSGGTGDADMYVKFGSAPTDTVYDCRPYLGGNAETCTFAAPQAGTYHVRVKAYSTFSGVSLVGDYSTGGGGSQTYTNGTDYTISDNATVESPISVSGRTGNGSATTPVAVNIVHTYIGDLKVDLVAPDGSVYVLHNRSGGSADNINQTYTVNLSSEPLNGSWKLRVNDNANQDTGYINSWSITF